MVIALIGLWVGARLVVATESRRRGNYQASQQCLYAAEAGVERAIGDLRLLANVERCARAVVHNISDRFQRRPDECARAPDGPCWISYSSRPAASRKRRVLPDRCGSPGLAVVCPCIVGSDGPGAATASAYVIVWLADDLDELDGNPAIDTNDSGDDSRGSIRNPWRQAGRGSHDSAGRSDGRRAFRA